MSCRDAPGRAQLRVARLGQPGFAARVPGQGQRQLLLQPHVDADVEHERLRRVSQPAELRRECRRPRRWLFGERHDGSQRARSSAGSSAISGSWPRVTCLAQRAAAAGIGRVLLDRRRILHPGAGEHVARVHQRPLAHPPRADAADPLPVHEAAVVYRQLDGSWRDTYLHAQLRAGDHRPDRRWSQPELLRVSDHASLGR